MTSGGSRDAGLLLLVRPDALLRHFWMVKRRIKISTMKDVPAPTLAPTTVPRLRRLECLGSVGAFAGGVVAFPDGIATICAERSPSNLA